MSNQRPFTWIAAAVFTIIGLIHAVRLFTGFKIVIGSHSIPMWVSMVAIVVCLGLGWMLCREARGRSTT